MAPSSVWLLGASISVAAQFVSMLGTVLMRGKSSATRLTSSYPRAAAAFDTANTSRIAWVAGVLCVVIGTVADFVALSITREFAGVCIFARSLALPARLVFLVLQPRA